MLNTTNWTCFDYISIEHGFCFIFVEFLVNKEVQTYPLISIFNLMCESNVVFNPMNMNCNYVCSFWALCYGLQILVIKDNHEYGVLLN